MKLNEFQKAILFALFLIIFIGTNICVIAFEMQPVVIGTELETNGYIEYLCLGTGCEALR